MTTATERPIIWTHLGLWIGRVLGYLFCGCW